MHIDLTSKRARKLIEDYHLTEDELRQIIAAARINLATFDPEYRANVTQLSQELDRSRPTIYSWADRALEATVTSLRNIRTGRPPKETLNGRRARRRLEER
ncbi:MAG TPA: hypothetical protein VFZ66_28955 [Herpetosiphonaceae bacterium]